MKNKLTYLITLLVIIFSLSMLFACAKNSSNDNVAPVNDSDKKSEYGYGENNEYDAFKSKSNASTDTSSKSSSNTALDGRKVIFTASLEIESTNYTKSIGILEKMIETYGGYIQDSNVETNSSSNNMNSSRTATYTIRIPAGKMNAFLSKSGDIGNIILNTSKGEDVTDQFFDTQAHLNSLKIQEERLLELLKKATTLKDILDLEDRISQVRYEIEQLTGTLQKLTSRVDLSTVTITIKEVETITAPKPVGFWAQVGETFATSVDALVTTLKTLSLILVAVSPFVFTLLVIAIIVFFFYRLVNRKKKPKG